MLGPLLEVEMSKKCTALWREAHLEVKIVLVTFLICIVLALFAAVKAVIISGCQQDAGICESGLTTLRNFLTKMPIGDSTIYTDEDIAGACDTNSLLTCEMVAAKFTKSTIMTSVFSLLASIFSLQMLFNAATLHEQAVWRRRAMAAKDERRGAGGWKLQEMAENLGQWKVDELPK
eukprot:s439_g17.t1